MGSSDQGRSALPPLRTPSLATSLHHQPQVNVKGQTWWKVPFASFSSQQNQPDSTLFVRQTSAMPTFGHVDIDPTFDEVALITAVSNERWPLLRRHATPDPNQSSIVKWLSMLYNVDEDKRITWVLGYPDGIHYETEGLLLPVNVDRHGGTIPKVHTVKDNEELVRIIGVGEDHGKFYLVTEDGTSLMLPSHVSSQGAPHWGWIPHKDQGSSSSASVVVPLVVPSLADIRITDKYMDEAATGFPKPPELLAQPAAAAPLQQTRNISGTPSSTPKMSSSSTPHLNSTPSGKQQRGDALSSTPRMTAIPLQVQGTPRMQTSTPRMHVTTTLPLSAALASSSSPAITTPRLPSMSSPQSPFLPTNSPKAQPSPLMRSMAPALKEQPALRLPSTPQIVATTPRLNNPRTPKIHGTPILTTASDIQQGQTQPPPPLRLPGTPAMRGPGPVIPSNPLPMPSPRQQLAPRSDTSGSPPGSPRFKEAVYNLPGVGKDMGQQILSEQEWDKWRASAPQSLQDATRQRLHMIGTMLNEKNFPIESKDKARELIRSVAGKMSEEYSHATAQ